MRAVKFVFGIGWAAFWIYWIVAALSTKRGRVPWSRELRVRAAIFVVVIVLIRVGAFRDHGLSSDRWRAGVGLVLFAVGLGFAIWARIHIGRNWGTPMSQKYESELVTSGPYRFVRHPIYSGILLAGAGTAVALSWVWLIAVALAGVYFIYSAIIEERNLTQLLPTPTRHTGARPRCSCPWSSSRAGLSMRALISRRLRSRTHPQVRSTLTAANDDASHPNSARATMAWARTLALSGVT
jgi:protein-S-isoprenylcysteine O-methyltransferase Ste14